MGANLLIFKVYNLFGRYLLLHGNVLLSLMVR